MANYENIKPYAEFAHVAAQHGGVHEYMNQIAEYNYSLGAMQGASDAYMTSFVVGGICMVISAGFYFYNKHKQSAKEIEYAEMKKRFERKIQEDADRWLAAQLSASADDPNMQDENE